jgi:hypothetical protein
LQEREYDRCVAYLAKNSRLKGAEQVVFQVWFASAGIPEPNYEELGWAV